MAAMQVVWGAYRFTAGACRFAVRTDAVLDARHLPYLYESEIDVTGRLYGDGDAALSTAEAALRFALSTPRQDFGVLRTNGARSATFWPTANTIGGNVVVKGPHFQGTTAAEYCLYREFTFTVRNAVPLVNVANAILEFRETAEYDGGEPEFAFKKAINARPQKQLVWFATEYRVTQSGRAVGFTDYPNPARLLFPLDKDKSPKFVRESPERHDNKYWRYPLSWTYSYASVGPLIAVPNRWVP